MSTNVVLAVDGVGIVCPRCNGSGVDPLVPIFAGKCLVCIGHGHVAPCLGNRAARVMAKLPVPQDGEWAKGHEGC